ncbi:MAG: glycosyltransferase [Verrucomicrobia bacterium]|nr:glycosyltransferase [Verrucomicrobiota bacterium]
MKLRFDQLVSGYAEGDAISQEARRLSELAMDAGFVSDIFCPHDRIAPGMTRQCKVLEEYRGDARDVLLYHYGLASPAGDVFRAAAARRLLRYHNVTPSEYFVGFDDDVATQLRDARHELPGLSHVSLRVWADSNYNAEEIRNLGHQGVIVAPLFFRQSEWDIAPEATTLAKFKCPMANFLFVGRIAPNKGIEDLIQAFAFYHGGINAHSRLIIVGSAASCPRYFAMLRLLAAQLNLQHVCFEGFVTDAQLAAYYRIAHVFVTASHHEGYCLPLIEAMTRGVPVLARATGGMPETLDGAGVLFDELPPAVLAELMHMMVTDSALRENVLNAQQQRCQALRDENMSAAFAALLKQSGIDTHAAIQ